jgi:hypothetical protein
VELVIYVHGDCPCVRARVGGLHGGGRPRGRKEEGDDDGGM